MGEIKKVIPVKIFCGLIYSEEKLVEKVKKLLCKKFGEIDFVIGPFLFNFTDYYEKEMGKNLKRMFFSFKRPVIPEKIYRWKIYTNKIEQKFYEENLRKVNIDPGYIDLSKVVLLSTKDFSHRLHLGKGIYGEITLKFEKGSFVFLPWTYPDYKTENYLNFFRKIREIYKTFLNEKKDVC